MLVPLGFAVLIALVAVALWLGYSAYNQVKELRRELDETQRQLNDLKMAAEAAAAPPPPLPKSRSSGLEDLREQLRAAHREDEPDE